MKKIFTQMKWAFLFVSALFMVQMSSAQQRTTIAGWTFPAVPSSSTIILSADCGNGTIYGDGTNGSSRWTKSSGSSTAGIYFGNAGVAPTTGVCEETAATKSFQTVGNAYNDSSIVFVVSTKNFVNVGLTFNERGSSAGFTTQTWAHSTNGVTFTTDTVLTGLNSGTTSSFANNINISFSNTADDKDTLYIKVTFSGASGTGNNRMDNFRVTGESNLPVTEQPVFSQIQGNYCQTFSVEITCSTENSTIYYTTDGTNPDRTNGILYTAPVAINTTTNLQAIAYADGLDSSLVKSALYTLPTALTSVSEFIEADENGYYRLDCELTAIYKKNSYFFAQDTANALCIYGTGISTYSNGDVITGGVCGTKGNYNGLIELTNPVFINPTATPGTAIEPLAITIAELNANWSNYECRLVSVSNVAMEQGTFSTSTNAKLNITQNGDTAVCANQFNALNNYTAPVNNINLTGIAIPRNEEKRICPRTLNDIVEIIPSIAIVAPTDEQVFEQGDPILADIQTQFFNYENNSMIECGILQNGENIYREFIHNATELSIFESTDLTAHLNGFGDYNFYASLVNADSTLLNAQNTDTIRFTFIASYIAIETSETELNFTETGETHTFTVTGFRLSNAITISTDNSDFVVTPSTLPANANGDTVTITFVGTETAFGTLTLASDTTVATVALNCIIPIDTLIYSVGFEVAEEFTAGSNYQNDNPVYFGPDAQKWGTIHGKVTGTDAIVGSQTMQMRYYGTAGNNHEGHLGYIYTNFDLHNVTKVEFSSKSTGNLKLRATFSHDGGETYEGDSVFNVGQYAQRFTYHITDSGEYYSVRVKFAVELPETAPTGTVRLTVDAVDVYGVLGLEPNICETPVISEPSAAYINPITVNITCATENARIYYTLDGTTPDEEDSLYTAPITIGSTCTLKAKAFKGGMDPSNSAFAEYTFPTEVANIAEFKAAGAIESTYAFKITGDVTFVYRNGRRIFIEDATGGLLVFDETTSVITNTYSEGDVISGGIIGTYTLYNGMTEMIPSTNWPAASGTATVSPVLVSINNLMDQFDTYEARLVRINGGTFTNGANFNTSEYTDAELEDGTGSLIVRNQFKTLDTTLDNGTLADVIGFASRFVQGGTSTYQLFPRTNADIIITDTTMIEEAAAIRLQVYPNPTTDNVTINADCNGGVLEVVNGYGQVVFRTENPTYPTVIPMNSQAAGLYFVRVITSDNHVVITKVTKR